MNRWIRSLIPAALIFMLLLAACSGAPAQPEEEAPAGGETAYSPVPVPETEMPPFPAPAPVTEAPETEADTEEETAMTLIIDDTEVSVEWEDNASVEALRALASERPLTIDMSMYGGNEQVGPIGTRLPRSDTQTVTEAGDIVLYAGNQLVIFYGSTSWAYTRLGRITDLSASELRDLLGNGDVTVTVSLQ